MDQNEGALGRTALDDRRQLAQTSRRRLNTNSRDSVKNSFRKTLVNRGIVANRRRIGHLSHSLVRTACGAS
jgi:hypothetical protein